MLEHKAENPHYDETATAEWLQNNGLAHLIPMARINTEEEIAA